MEKKNEGKTGLSILDKAAVALTWLMLSAVWKGFVFQRLWAWFVVPALGLQPLNLPAAIGVSFIFTLCFFTPLAAQTDPVVEALHQEKVSKLVEALPGGDAKKWGHRAVGQLLDPSQVVNTIITPAMYLALGWLMSRFV